MVFTCNAPTAGELHVQSRAARRLPSIASADTIPFPPEVPCTFKVQGTWSGKVAVFTCSAPAVGAMHVRSRTARRLTSGAIAATIRGRPGGRPGGGCGRAKEGR